MKQKPNSRRRRNGTKSILRLPDLDLLCEPSSRRAARSALPSTSVFPR